MNFIQLYSAMYRLQCTCKDGAFESKSTGFKHLLVSFWKIWLRIDLWLCYVNLTGTLFKTLHVKGNIPTEDLCSKRELENKSELKERWRTTLIRSILTRKKGGRSGMRKIHCGWWVAAFPRRFGIVNMDQRFCLCELLSFQQLTSLLRFLLTDWLTETE
jgi:hypothetical protein